MMSELTEREKIIQKELMKILNKDSSDKDKEISKGRVAREMLKQAINSIHRKKKQMSLDTEFKKLVKKKNPDLYWECVKEIKGD